MTNFNGVTVSEIFTVLSIIVIIGIVQLAGTWRVYEKAGKPGWACLIPFYNFFVLLQMVEKPEWWIVWLFVPFANIVVPIWVKNLLSKSFGKDEAFTLGLIFLPFIFYPILGFGNSSYQGGAGKPKVTEIRV